MNHHYGRSEPQPGVYPPHPDPYDRTPPKSSGLTPQYMNDASTTAGSTTCSGGRTPFSPHTTAHAHSHSHSHSHYGSSSSASHEHPVLRGAPSLSELPHYPTASGSPAPPLSELPHYPAASGRQPPLYPTSSTSGALPPPPLPPAPDPESLDLVLTMFCLRNYSGALKVTYHMNLKI